MSDDLAADITSVAALSEPVRRGLYRYVVSQDEPVSRESAAAATGVAHHVAKFNLDRLVTDGLLEVEYRRPPGRSGPGAGRPTKLYRRAARDISVTLPERHYDLAGRILAEAVTIAGRDGVPMGEALQTAAREAGRHLGEEAGSPSGTPQSICGILGATGYEPRTTDGEVVLANCPFHDLAQRYTALVCGMNLHLIDGLLDALDAEDLRARLDPGPDRCCVTIGRD
ncbi:helix-turn-helix transcriptional regulator [Couchioplanes azureus]|uniref:helix-turn-helix transcriptional regulator n=1 Tax=Couchioplanes caeruleus TaxID=56438 RepID=UPI0016710D9D|nr:helix-turn-helix domain-containing protein [Couchioplanes caeruleus]GGQ72393.1 ArsR family transcriptional regulator [Couchioplanes caeruleus subsp. azureus]